MNDQVNDPSQLVVVGTFGTPEEAHLARNRLELAGIESGIVDEWTGWQPHLTGDRGGVRVLTKSSDAEHAAAILRQVFPPASTTEVGHEVRNKLLAIVGLATAIGVISGYLTGEWIHGVEMAGLTFIVLLFIIPCGRVLLRALRGQG